ncbi:MAG: response regulator transcription factor, partial [Rhodococcus sp. (in: high G+C Gram-positive bacteria)]
MPISVLLVDDQELMRMGLAMVLGAHDDIEVIGQATDGATAIAAAARLEPDVVLMDVRMPGIDGVSATERIVSAQPAVRVIVMTTFDLDEHALGALRAGASGFLLKDTPPESLVSAIRSVAAGDAVVSPRVTKRLISRIVAGERRDRAGKSSAVESLTDREKEV